MEPYRYLDLPPTAFEDLQEQADNIRKEWMENFYRHLDRALAAAASEGKDVAVSDFYFDMETQSHKLDVVSISPGSPLPTGKRWTVYHSSR